MLSELHDISGANAQQRGRYGLVRKCHPTQRCEAASVEHYSRKLGRVRHHRPQLNCCMPRVTQEQTRMKLLPRQCACFTPAVVDELLVKMTIQRQRAHMSPRTCPPTRTNSSGEASTINGRTTNTNRDSSPKKRKRIDDRRVQSIGTLADGR